MAAVERSHPDEVVKEGNPPSLEIPPPHKRKTSPSLDDDPDSSGKRARLRSKSPPNSRANADPPSEAPTDADQERRKSATQEEKKRGKRLFGGLLSTLSQTDNNPKQKRRQEIEERQRERLKQQREADDKANAERRAIQHKARCVEQIVFEEDAMKSRHRKMLSTAHYLQTKAKPHIYYLPWKRTQKQEDIIDDQIREAEARIRGETEAFKVRKEEHIQRYGRPHRVPASESVATPEQGNAPPLSKDANVGDTKEGPAQSLMPPPAGGRTTTTRPKGEDVEERAKEPEEHHDDVIEEADEDTVIY